MAGKLFPFRLRYFFLTLVLVGSSIYPAITPTQFEYLNDLLDRNRLEELIAEGEELKLGNQENLELRTLLFLAYLKHSLEAKAEEEITFLESRIRNSQTLYLRALQAHHSNDNRAALSLLQRIKEIRYAPPYLLYHQILMEEGKFSEAKKYLDQYRGLEGENEQWFFYYGQYILKYSSPEKIKTEFIDHIQKYSRTFPANHRQMYLRADYYAAQGQFDRALDYIEKALYLSSHRPDYLSRKIYYLYRDQQLSELIEVINSYQFTDRNWFLHTKWVKSFVYFIQMKNENSFVLLSPEMLSQVLTPLEEILQVNPEHEIIRYFAEEVMLANTSPDDKRRKVYADYRQQNGIDHQGKGNWEGAEYSFNRMLRLIPQDPNYLETHLEYLRLTQQYERYQAQANKYLALYPATNQENHDIPIRKQLADHTVSQTLAGRYQIAQLIPPRQLLALLTYEPQSYQHNWDQPYLQTLSARMIGEALQAPPLFQVDLAATSPNQIGVMMGKKDYDYHMAVSVNDRAQILTVTLIVKDKKKVTVYNRTHSFYGKERYQKMVNSLQQWMYTIFPKIGRVARVKDRQAVISLGSRHGVQPQDRVSVIKNGKKLGSFPLEVVDNYYSLITIDKIFVLSQTEIGDRVILEVE